jgi:hypothetical protein
VGTVTGEEAFRAAVLPWLQGQFTDAAKITSVEPEEAGDETRWCGLRVRYTTTSGIAREWWVSDSDMEELWRYVMAAWPAP